MGTHNLGTMLRSCARLTLQVGTPLRSLCSKHPPHGSFVPHFRNSQQRLSTEWINPTTNHVWTDSEIDEKLSTQPRHKPENMADRLSIGFLRAAYWTFNKVTGYRAENPSPASVAFRLIFLESVAAVPGMVAAQHRHFRSLRTLDRDHGWIHTLLEEAENERMHLLVFVTMKQPGPFFRAAVVGAQGIFMTAFVAAYCIYPPLCHRFVGYLEEEAVHTYSDIIKSIDNGSLEEWKTELAPQIAVDYWHM